MTAWPLQKDCAMFYGNPRGVNGQASLTWQKQNLKLITPPYKIYFLGKPARVNVHQKTVDAWMEWFEAVWKNAGQKQKTIDLWGMSNYSGGFNFRPMTGGETLSMHSYGAATDWDAPRNGWKNARPNFANYYEEIVAPFIKLGGVWGGDWNGNRNTIDERACDGMHFQFARLR